MPYASQDEMDGFASETDTVEWLPALNPYTDDD